MTTLSGAGAFSEFSISFGDQIFRASLLTFFQSFAFSCDVTLVSPIERRDAAFPRLLAFFSTVLSNTSHTSMRQTFEEAGGVYYNRFQRSNYVS
jgi:hypothetical protein